MLHAGFLFITNPSVSIQCVELWKLHQEEILVAINNTMCTHKNIHITFLIQTFIFRKTPNLLFLPFFNVVTISLQGLIKYL